MNDLKIDRYQECKIVKGENEACTESHLTRFRIRFSHTNYDTFYIHDDHWADFVAVVDAMANFKEGEEA